MLYSSPQQGAQAKHNPLQRNLSCIYPFLFECMTNLSSLSLSSHFFILYFWVFLSSSVTVDSIAMPSLLMMYLTPCKECLSQRNLLSTISFSTLFFVLRRRSSKMTSHILGLKSVTVVNLLMLRVFFLLSNSVLMSLFHIKGLT